MYLEPVKVTGLCDAKCGKEATKWYGRTNMAYCGDTKCYQIVDAKYIKHCEQVDNRIRFRQEMEEEFGKCDWVVI